MHAAVVRAGVDVALVGGRGGREVAADEGFEDAVAAEGDEGAVVGVGRVVKGVVRGEAVVEVCCVILELGVSGMPRFERRAEGLTWGLMRSPTSVETIFRRSQSLQVWSLALLITYRPSPLESMYVRPSVWPKNMPAGLMELKLRRSQTLSVVSSEPE